MKHELLTAGALDIRQTVVPLLLLTCAYATLYAVINGNVVPFPEGQGIPGPESEDSTGIENEKDGERENPREKLIWCEKHQTMHWPPACK